MPNYHAEVQIARQLITNIEVPILNQELLELQSLLNEHEIPNLQTVVQLLSANPFIAAELVSLANMPIFNQMSMPIKDLEGALFRLGLNNLRHYILAIHFKQNVLNKGMRGLSYHSQLIAVIAGIIASLTTKIKSAEAYLLGLVHDIGSFVINQLDTNYGMTFHSKQQQYHSNNEHEFNRYGTSHSALGYVLAEQMALPNKMAQTILLHHEPNIKLIKDPELRFNVALIEMAHLLDIRSRHKYKQLSIINQQTFDLCREILDFDELLLRKLNNRLELMSA